MPKSGDDRSSGKDSNAAAGEGVEEITRREAMSPPSVLSRASTYASLKSYDTGAAAVSSTPTSVPKNLQDASLMTFWGKISEDIHRTMPRLDCKNTAGRPLSAVDMTGRMQQRSLTLIGGGFNKVIGSTTGTPNTKATAQSAAAPNVNSGLINSSNTSASAHALGRQSKRNRKRKRDQLMGRIQPSMVSTEKSISSSSKASSRHLQYIEQRDLDRAFLRRLNAEWNHYLLSLLPFSAEQLLSAASGDGMDAESTGIAKWATRHADSIEWIGARVRVDQCPMSIGYEKVVAGILISQSTNVWSVMVHDIEEASQHENSTSDSGATTRDKRSRTRRQPRLVLVPKKGTVLTVFIPLDTSMEDSSENGRALASSRSLAIALSG